MGRAAKNRCVQAPGWAEICWLRHGFSTRVGGVSEVYGGGGALNLGWTPEDDPQAVAMNRRRLVEEVGRGVAMDLVTLRQVHSTEVHVIGDRQDVPTAEDGRAVLTGDGMMTDVPGLLLGVGTADCVPVLVADVRRRVVAGFHAGWRGTVEGIVERGVATMRRAYGSEPGDLVAAIGPSIGACCYAVGEEVQTRFRERYGYAEELFSQGAAGGGAAVVLDLWEANRRQLLAAGVAPERISVVAECTSCFREADGGRRYFSHRAEHGVTGRMLSVIGIAAPRER